MKAMIFAAGLGTRLRPLTNDRPKALVEINGVSLLEINIRRLIHFGVREIVINVHHFAERIEAFLVAKKHFGIRIEISDERDMLRETGGGLRHAQWFFKGDTAPFLVCNADILCDIDLQKLYAAHVADGEAIATFAVQRRKTSRYMLLNEQMRLYGWTNSKTGEIRQVLTGLGRHIEQDLFSFSCFQVLNPAVFEDMPNEEFFTMIDWYLHLAAHGKTVRGYLHEQDDWADVGTIAALEAAAPLAAKLLGEVG
jgi:NDP-sugar pyrophosphorylase family protein